MARLTPTAVQNSGNQNPGKQKSGNLKPTSRPQRQAPATSSSYARLKTAHMLDAGLDSSPEEFQAADQADQQDQSGEDDVIEKPSTQRRNASPETSKQTAHDGTVVNEAVQPANGKSSTQHGHAKRVADALSFAEEIRKSPSRNSFGSGDANPSIPPQQRNLPSGASSVAAAHAPRRKSTAGARGAATPEMQKDRPTRGRKPLEASSAPVAKKPNETGKELTNSRPNERPRVRRRSTAQSRRSSLSVEEQNWDTEPNSDEEQGFDTGPKSDVDQHVEVKTRPVKRTSQSSGVSSSEGTKRGESDKKPVLRESSRLPRDAPPDHVIVSEDNVETPHRRRSTRAKKLPPNSYLETSSPVDEDIADSDGSGDRGRGTHAQGELAEYNVFAVRRIMQEDDGRYLVDWEDTPDGKEYPQTWEAKENVGLEAIRQWEEAQEATRKEEQDAAGKGKKGKGAKGVKKGRERRASQN